MSFRSFNDLIAHTSETKTAKIGKKDRQSLLRELIKTERRRILSRKAGSIKPICRMGIQGDALDAFILQSKLLESLDQLYPVPDELLGKDPGSYDEKESKAWKDWYALHVPKPGEIDLFLPERRNCESSDQYEALCHRRILSIFTGYGYGPRIRWNTSQPPFKLKGEAATLYFAKIDTSPFDYPLGSNRQWVFKVGITQRTFEERFDLKGARELMTPLRTAVFLDGRDAWLREQKVIQYSHLLEEQLYFYPSSDQKSEYKRRLLLRKKKEKSRQVFDAKTIKIRNRLAPSEWVFCEMDEGQAVKIFDQLCDFAPYC
jgi:hypothetical protein